MSTTIDLPAVRRFTDDLKERQRRCEIGEGTICTNLEDTINHYVQLCTELREFIQQWARAIFTGQIKFDPAAEDLLKTDVAQLLQRAEQVAAQGRAMNGYCFILEALNALHWHIADFDYLLRNWVSPRLAVSPTPRIKLSDAAQRQIAERLNELSALPTDWRPSDPRQLGIFQQQRAAQ
jgi:hypothetical protein